MNWMSQKIAENVKAVRFIKVGVNGLQVHVRAGLRAETIIVSAKDLANRCIPHRTTARLAGTLLLLAVLN